MADTRFPATQFAIRVPAIDALFVELDARPMPERPLSSEVRLYLLDAWERVRRQHPSTLTVYAPESERAGTDGWTEIISGAVATKPTGAKPLNASYGTLDLMIG